MSPPRAEGSREPSKNAGRNRPAQSSQHPSQVCRQPAVTGAGQAEFAAHFGDESAPNDAGEHDLGQQPAQMGRPESANHGSTRNKSKSFQASRRAGRAVRKREQQGAGRTRRSGAVPAGLHWSSQLPVCRRAVLQGSGSAKGWRRRTNVWREATSPAHALRSIGTAIPPTRAIVPNNKEELNRTFAEVRASRNTIETVSLSRRNNFHANVCAPVELAPSRQATNGQRRYSCRALRSRYTPEALTRERKYD